MRLLLISFIVSLLFIFSCEQNADIDNSNLQKKDSIIIVDLLPDSIIVLYEYTGDTTSSMDFDINRDSIIDVRISASYWGSFSTPHCDEGFRISIKSLHEDSKVGIKKYANCNAFSIDSTTEINDKLQWGNYGLIYYRDCEYFGNSCSICTYRNDCVIPLSITKNENQYYGWILFTYRRDDSGGFEPYDELSVTIKKYALNLIPNSSIFYMGD
jgi:hypothetical protein